MICKGKGKRMKWIEVRAAYEEKEGFLIAELVADVFFDAGLSGVAIYDGLIQEEDDWADGALPEDGPPHVDGYFPEDGGFSRRLSDLEKRLAKLEGDTGARIALQHHCRDESEWAEAWKRHFHPMRIGKHLVVKPTWEGFEARPDDVILEIDPGMAFGTGSHATTALCLELIEKHVLGGESFLDIGCGSGILMIAAVKLGARRLTGVDKDPVALEVARKTLIQNRIDPAIFFLFAGNLAEGVSETFDMVVSNILTDVIVNFVPAIPGLLKPGGIFICSGMIDKNTHRVEREIKALGMTILGMPEKEGWVAIAAQR